METRKYTAVVVGSGPGGYPCAIRLAQLGVKTLCIERENWGGVCLNVGCIPSKALITAGKKFEELNHLAEMGIAVPAGATLDMAQLQKWKAGIVEKLTGGVRTLLKGNKADMLAGEAKFIDAHTLEVATKDGPVRVEAEHIVIATGSRPIQVPGFSFADDRVMDSTKALALSEKDGQPFAEANYANCLNGSYPLARFLYVYVNKSPSKDMDKLTSEFMTFVLSKQGQEIVIKDGYFPLTADTAAEGRASLKYYSAE